MSHLYIRFAPLAVIITSLCIIIFLVAQQLLRLGANELLIQHSTNIAQRLSHGESMPVDAPSGLVDIKTSLVPFLITFNDQGEVDISTAQLDGKTPSIPQNVLSNTKFRGQNQTTWEPEPGVRLAVVVTYYTHEKGSGFVLVGKSLRDVEMRINSLVALIGGGWIVTLFCVYAAVWATEQIIREHTYKFRRK